MSQQRGYLQFQNQLDDVDRPTPRDLIGSGNTSPTMTQAAGPQLVANTEILRQMKAIIALVAEWLCLSVFPAVAPIMPTINCIVIMPIAPYCIHQSAKSTFP